MKKRNPFEYLCGSSGAQTNLNPRDIPGGYAVDKHRAVAATIAKPADLSHVGEPLRPMACHETHDAHCIGWLSHQLGPVNNIALRLAIRSFDDAHRMRTVGEQQATFEDTLPKDAR